MCIEIVVYDRSRFRLHQALGQVRIGPNHSLDNHHWEEMVQNHGHVVKMTHALREI
jgi:hypothetical protein